MLDNNNSTTLQFFLNAVKCFTTLKSFLLLSNTLYLLLLLQKTLIQSNRKCQIIIKPIRTTVKSIRTYQQAISSIRTFQNVIDSSGKLLLSSFFYNAVKRFTTLQSFLLLSNALNLLLTLLVNFIAQCKIVDNNKTNWSGITAFQRVAEGIRTNQKVMNSSKKFYYSLVF